MKLFLDVDGVLLGKRFAGDPEYRLANDAIPFLAFVLEAFEVYWLTTHCRGDVGPVLRHLSWHTEEARQGELLALASRVRPTRFRTLKTEALPRREPFLWIDDAPLQVELEWLRSRGWEERWIHVDTRRRPDDLGRVWERLSKIPSS